MPASFSESRVEPHAEPCRLWISRSPDIDTRKLNLRDRARTLRTRTVRTVRVRGEKPDQTRRRLGGRQPLCGIAVTSRIDVTANPTACSARNADSRPEPGPLTSISSVRMPCSMAFFPASSAATCAAYGVDLREPLKPWLPDDDHAIALPWASVIVIIVLLNVALTWAVPDVMFLRSRRRKRGAAVPLAIYPFRR